MPANNRAASPRKEKKMDDQRQNKTSYVAQVIAEAQAENLDMTNITEWEECDFNLFSIVLDAVEKRAGEARWAAHSEVLAEKRRCLAECLSVPDDADYLSDTDVITFHLVHRALFGEPFHGDLHPIDQSLIFHFFNEALARAVLAMKAKGRTA